MKLTAVELVVPFNMFVNEQPNVRDAYHIASNWLQQHGIPDAEDSSRHMLAHAAGLGTRLSDFLHAQQQHVYLSPAQIATFQHYCIQRAKRVPLQYIIGEWDFYGMTLRCKIPVLIPRPETEELVEKAIKQLLSFSNTPYNILDVGAGTGAIGLALAVQLPQAKITAIDLNPIAVALANDNADHLLSSGSRDRYACLHMDFASFCQQSTQHYDMIISNPPYIPSAQLATLQEEVRDYEDIRALDGGVDGLNLILDLIHQSAKLLSARGTRTLWMETDPAHPLMLLQRFEDVDSTLQGAGIEAIEWFKDFSGHPRLIQIIFHSSACSTT